MAPERARLRPDDKVDHPGGRHGRHKSGCVQAHATRAQNPLRVLGGWFERRAAASTLPLGWTRQLRPRVEGLSDDVLEKLALLEIRSAAENG